jgi:hypothetical protein
MVDMLIGLLIELNIQYPNNQLGWNIKLLFLDRRRDDKRCPLQFQSYLVFLIFLMVQLTVFLAIVPEVLGSIPGATTFSE